MGKYLRVIVPLVLIITLSSYLTPQFLPLLTILSLILLIVEARRRYKKALTIIPLITSLILSLIALSLLIMILTKEVLLSREIFLMLMLCTYIPPLTPVVVYYVLVCRGMRYIGYLYLGISVLLGGIIIGIYEVMSNHVLIKEISELCKGPISILDTSLSLYICLSTPYSLILILTSMLILILVITKVFIEFS